MNHTKKKEGTKIERQTNVFAAAANALRWVEVHRYHFGTARRFRNDEILRIGVGMVADRCHRVRIGRIRQWEAARSKPAG